jgi:environmental stress-induced protein Ves
MHRLLQPADYARMPWKNGGGQTTEIAVHPAGATLADFAWRVSIAEITADGPFSGFAGVDRTLVLLSGAGVRLTGTTHTAELRVPYEPYTFSGDDATACTLVDGPVRDFNLMLRRGRVRGRTVVVREESARIEPARWRACHVAAGAVECLVPGHPPVAVAQDCTIVIDDADTAASGVIAVNPVSADAVALVAVIELAA